MKKTVQYRTKGVCASQITLVMEDDVIESVKFSGGCAGNTQGVASLVCGMTGEEAISRLRGIRCGFKNTSCPDQLANAIEACMASAGE